MELICDYVREASTIIGDTYYRVDLNIQPLFLLIDKIMAAIQIPQGKRYVTTYLNRDVIERLDKIRGWKPRSRIVEELLLEFVERETGSKNT